MKASSPAGRRTGWVGPVGGSDGSRGVSSRLGILIPCRDEGRVIERKLRNLGQLQWPPGNHRIVVVDDGSTDDTAAKARSCLATLSVGDSSGGPGGARVRSDLIRNQGAPGKPGALGEGLAHLSGEVDLVVLQDADVLLGPAALVEIVDAFASDPQLAMGCGSQHFVRALGEDGRLLDAGGGPLVPVHGAYDGITAVIRRLESRWGALFSVHGQLLAWRMNLELEPALGVAADDLDLMFQVRRRSSEPRGVRLIRGAEFYEVKEVGPRGKDQALRRTRAWFGFVPGAARGLGPEVSPGFRIQARLYGVLPQAFPILFGLAVAGLGVWLLGGPFGERGAPGLRWLLFLVITVLGLVLVVPRSRLLWRARALETRTPMGDQWDMHR